MDSKNIYKDEIDFAVLALQSPVFNKLLVCSPTITKTNAKTDMTSLKANGQLDFSNPAAVKYAILQPRVENIADRSVDSLRKAYWKRTLASKSIYLTTAFARRYNRLSFLSFTSAHQIYRYQIGTNSLLHTSSDSDLTG